MIVIWRCYSVILEVVFSDLEVLFSDLEVLFSDSDLEVLFSDFGGAV